MGSTRRKSMRLGIASVGAVAMALAAGVLLNAQGDPDRVIPGGGMFVAGWTGKIDAGSVRQGRKLDDAKFAQDGAGAGAGTILRELRVVELAALTDGARVDLAGPSRHEHSAAGNNPIRIALSIE